MLGWVFFRAADLPRALGYLADMFGARALPDGARLISGVLFQPYLLLALALAALVVWAGRQTWDWTQRLTLGKAVLCIALGWLALVVLATQEYNPFIYFIF
jgi:alginate O-acetyltransferase complex protein AlgI